MAAADLSATAYLTALARAQATRDPGSGFRDPFAARFAALCPPSVLGVTRGTAGTSVVVARGVLVDRMLADLLATGDIEVCVNLGAGFDARPFRMQWPDGCRVVEIDSAEVLDVKDQLLPAEGARVPLERLRCDLRDLSALGALLGPRTGGRRVAVIAEGLLPYFPEPYIAELCSVLAGAGLSVSMVCDVVSVESARGLTAAARAAGTALHMYGLCDTAVFEVAGWTCERFEALPTARAGTAAAARSQGASRLLPDGVLTLRAGRRGH